MLWRHGLENVTNMPNIIERLIIFALKIQNKDFELTMRTNFKLFASWIALSLLNVKIKLIFKSECVENTYFYNISKVSLNPVSYRRHIGHC